MKRRAFSSAAIWTSSEHKSSSSWFNRVPRSPVQCYISASHSPYVNLSVEHYLLETSPPESAVLFFYTNRPCIIIGRNQNPWLEVDLFLRRHKLLPKGPEKGADLANVELVRRRSGGGTVFHDHGNVNWTVISPTAAFTRDKHAEMIVRALRSCGIERARVNERHDIVLDQGEMKGASDPTDMHQTAYSVADDRQKASVKVSGSAYKLIRGRALHHGTCLLSSPNLELIPEYLHSPAKAHIRAKGVDSVSSPVGNIGLDMEKFCKAVSDQFQRMYNGNDRKPLENISENDVVDLEHVQHGIWELSSEDWIFGQTPHFTFSSRPYGDIQQKKSPVLPNLPDSVNIEFSVRRGKIEEGSLSIQDSPGQSRQSFVSIPATGLRLYDDWNWEDHLFPAGEMFGTETRNSISTWLNRILPTGKHYPPLRNN